MATDLERLVVQLSADVRQFERSMARASGVSNRQFNAIENRARRLNRNLDSIGRQAARSFIAPLAGIGAALGTRELIRMTDTWTDLNSRVRLAAGGMAEGQEVMQRLGEVARRTYSSLEQTAEGYLLNATALRELGYSTNQTLDYTEAVNNALVISGAKGQRAEAVMNALSKAMAGGALRGKNLNTVIEQGGRLAEALAEGLGVGVNQLRSLGQQGRITGRDIVSALSSQMERLRREAEEMPATIGDGVQLLQNAMLDYVGNADQATGVTARISEALVIMADNFDKTADAVLQVAGVIAGALIGRSIAGMIAKLGLAGSALISFTRALSAVRTVAGLTMAISGLGAAAGPVGLLIGGAVTAAVIAYSSSTAEARDVSEAYAAALEKVRARAEDAKDEIIEAADAVDEMRQLLAAAIDVGESETERLTAAVRRYIQLLATMPDVVSREQLDELRDLVERFQVGEVSAGDLRQAIEALASTNPDVAGMLDPLLADIEENIAAIRQLKAELTTLDSSPTFERGGRARARQALEATREEGRVYEEAALRRASLSRDQLALENEIARVKKQAADDEVKLTEAQVRRIAEANIAGNATRSAEGKTTRADEYERLTQRINEQVAAIHAENAALAALNPLVEDYGYALERARTEQDLLTAAERAGLEVTDDLRTEIAGLADQYAQASVEARKLAESQDEIRRRAEEMRDLQRDVARGIVDGFRQGRDAADIFADALDRIASKLLDIAFDNMFSAAGGGVGSGLGGLLGFSGGGYTGAGGTHQPAGVVHRGEYVFSKAATSRIGVANLDALHRSMKGFAAGGYVGGGVTPVAGKTIEVNVYNEAPNTVATATRRDDGGIQVLIRQIKAEVAADITSGGQVGRAIGGAYGVKRSVR